MFLSPFEQFKIEKMVSLELGSFDISITNSTLYMFLGVFIHSVMYKMNIEKGRVVPGR